MVCLIWLVGCQAGVPGVELMQELAGLWSGPATGTPLGTLAPMNMDLRAADPRVLFARSDLDATDSLRFAFFVETYSGSDVLVFRNGGYFQGVLRDSRMTLLSHNGQDYHFCALDGGCSYIDARFDFSGDSALTLTVLVNGQHHLTWPARRLESRTLPSPFPASPPSLGTGDAPWPAMPTLTVHVGWTKTLAAGAVVWVILSAEDCQLGACTFSRSISQSVPAGASGADVVFEQIHAGAYKATAVLDPSGTLGATMQPVPGDGVSLPNQPVSVGLAGSSSAALEIVYYLP